MQVPVGIAIEPGWIAALMIVWLYAEMHLRTRFWRGRLFKKEPEIVFDAPRRVETDYLPVALVIKDAHWFPVTLAKVCLTIKTLDQADRQEFCFTENLTINQKWLVRIYNLPVARLKQQQVTVCGRAFLRTARRAFQVHNDNYATLSHRPLTTFIDDEPRPAAPGWHWGDLHLHSHWTADAVEFGLPAAYIPALAQPMGLSFGALIEHSYDLDDQPDSWFANDPELHKWQDYLAEVQEINRSNPAFVLLPGEEVSVDNGLGSNVHMAVLNSTQFFPGTGDGLEKSLGYASESHFARILDLLPETSLAFATHPFTHPVFSHRLIIRRDTWNPSDWHRNLSGWQILNGHTGDDFETGKRHWIKHLLAGRRLRIFAGNDAHGNFNRFRQIKVPLWSMHEHDHQVCGAFVTGVRVAGRLAVTQLSNSLKSAPSLVSNGPFLAIDWEKAADANCSAGGLLKLDVRSSHHFGSLRRLIIYAGDVDRGREQEYKTFDFPGGALSIQRQISIAEVPARGYWRAELYTRTGHFALTNPLWLNQC